MSIFGTPSKGSGGNGNTSTIASAVNTNLGDLIVVAIALVSSSTVITSVTDSAGNTYTRDANSHIDDAGANGLIAEVWYCLAATQASATNVITVVHGNGNFYNVLYVWSIPITGGTAHFDDITAGAFDSTAHAITPTFNTDGLDEIVLAIVLNLDGFKTSAAGSGYTLDDGALQGGEGASEHALFSSIQTGIVADFTWTGATPWIITAAAFNAGAAPPPVNVSHSIDADVIIPTEVSEIHNIDADVQVDMDTSHNVDADVVILPPVDKSHNVDADVIVSSEISFIRLSGNIIFLIDPTQGYVRLAATVLEPQLSFVNLAATIKGSGEPFVNLAGTVQRTIRNYVRLAGTVSNDKLPTHNVDAAISTQGTGFVQLAAQIVEKVSPGPCMNFPDASYVKLAAWIVIPGDSHQMPNSGFSLADDFLSSQIALAAYKPMSLISLAGFNLIVTAFTAGVFSWQTRARTWLTRQDEAPNGILLTTTTKTETLPNGAVITTTTQVKLVQDVQVTIVTIKNSNTPERTSVIVTEKNQSGQTVTRETDTVNINGVINTSTKKTVFTQPPVTDNIQPITVRTLDGVQHFQFFSEENTEWAGGDQEGVTQTQTQQKIILGTLNGKTQDQFGNPILTRVNDTIENEPDGKLVHTHTEETGIRGVGTTTTDTQDSFNGIIDTTTITTTYPDGSQEIKKIVKNRITGDTIETSTEIVTDEFGQVTTTVTNTEIKTFVDPNTGALRQVTTKTVNVTKSGVTTIDNTVVTTDNFDDAIVNDKIKVIAIQEFTIACVIDEFTMFALWEINETHQKQYALQELFGQQLGNANLTFALRQRLIQQFNAANCVPCVPLQANGRTWCVVFAPSASAFRPKLIIGTEPHVYELQLIVQARSNLIDGTVGF